MKKRKKKIETLVAKEPDIKPSGRLWGLLWILPFLTALFFNLSVLDNHFVWDDYNIFKYQIPSLSSLKDFFFPGQNFAELGTHYFRPFVLISYKVDMLLWGESFKGPHLTVLCSHCLNTVLVYFFSLILFAKKNTRYSIAFFSSMLFAVFPVHAEVVAWICGRNESLATNFALLSLISYGMFRNKERIVWLLLSGLFFLMALFCKEVATAVLFLIPLYDLCFYRKNYSPLTKWNENLSIYACFGVVFFVYYILRKISLGGGFGLTAFNHDIGLIRALVCSVGYYLKVSAFPVHLNYFITEIPSSDTFFAASFLAIAALIVAAVYGLWKGKRALTFCILGYFFALGPSLSIAITYISETPLALRYLYFPSVCFFILLGYWLRFDHTRFFSKISLGRILKVMIFLILFIFYQRVNVQEIRVWKDDTSLWNSVLEKSPDMGFAHGHLAKQYALNGEYEKAIAHGEKALEAADYDAEGKSIVSNTMGYIYLQLDKLDEAEAYYYKAIGLRPTNYALPYYNLGYLGLNREERMVRSSPNYDPAQRMAILEQSRRFFQKAIEIHPYYYKARFHLGVCYLKMGRKKQAQEQFDDLIKMDKTGKWAAAVQKMLSQPQ